MTKLTDTQTLILRTASHHPGGLAAPPASLPPAPRGAVAKSLVGAGLMEVLPTAKGEDASLVWKLDGEVVLLRISDAGLAAIGITVTAGQGAPAPAQDGEATMPTMRAGGPQQAPQGPDHTVDAAEAAEPPQDAPGGPQQGTQGATAGSEAAAASPPSTGRTAPATALRSAAQQVLAA
ncbi:hypothetical protein JMJ56_28845 [Belnapia sp. T18]|uniref:Flagellar hook-length control protein FliK n=1 Tax=Belnapia arida TaxID=2804533 RepID=A0ABS1UBC4_9PROT|nr:hypothetical protein [Belnapia arida]MBL6081992.1 hypothetical protein [Belnapia arida]